MLFKVPGQDVSVRLFERVETVDSQYDFYDVGLQQADGSIDSVVMGGSFSYAKSLCRKADEIHAANKATVAVTAEQVEAVANAVAA